MPPVGRGHPWEYQGRAAEDRSCGAAKQNKLTSIIGHTGNFYANFYFLLASAGGHHTGWRLVVGVVKKNDIKKQRSDRNCPHRC